MSCSRLTHTKVPSMGLSFGNGYSSEAQCLLQRSVPFLLFGVLPWSTKVLTLVDCVQVLDLRLLMKKGVRCRYSCVGTRVGRRRDHWLWNLLSNVSHWMNLAYQSISLFNAGKDWERPKKARSQGYERTRRRSSFGNRHWQVMNEKLPEDAITDSKHS